MGFALVAWLLGIDPRPDGRPERCGRPLHQRVAEAGRALEPPGDPRFCAPACGHWGDSGVLVEGSGGGRACTLLATGDQEAGSQDGAGSWEGLEEGTVGMALGTLGHGGVKGLESVAGDTERAEQGLDEQGRRGAAPPHRWSKAGRL